MDSARVLIGGRAVPIIEAAMLAPELLEAARQGLIAVEADIEEREGQNAELRLPNEGDPVLAVFRERADTIRAAIARATGTTSDNREMGRA